MAYVSQELKAKIAPVVKAICKKYRVSGTMSVDHHSTLVLTIKSGSIDFIESNRRTLLLQPRYAMEGLALREVKSLDVNPYWYKEHFDGKALAFLSEVIPAMNVGNHDRSDSMTDYFDVGWYIKVAIGKWNKPYEYIKGAA